MNNVGELLARAGMSQKELAITLGIAQPSVSAWVSQKADPSRQNVYRLAQIFNVEPDAIVPMKQWSAEYPAGVALRVAAQPKPREDLSESELEIITRKIQQRMGVAPTITPAEQELLDDFRQLTPVQKSRIRATIAGYLDAKLAGDE